MNINIIYKYIYSHIDISGFKGFSVWQSIVLPALVMQTWRKKSPERRK